MDYNEWRLQVIKLICLDGKVSDNIKLNEIEGVIGGSFDDEFGEGYKPQEAWMDALDGIESYIASVGV